MPQGKSRLEGKVAIVTGAGARGKVMGNGKAAAILFAREGARVVAMDVSEERLADTIAAIREEDGDAIPFVGDVTKSADCQAMVKAAVSKYGKLDFLHNNVGINGPGSVVDVSEDDWDKVMDVNLKSMVLTSKHAIPEMIKNGSGAIVNISSISAIRPRGMTSYTVSKAGVVALTKAMALDYASQKIRVNCLLPGPAYTSMVAGGMSEEMRELRRQASPLGVEGTSWDIAHAALFLASDEARWITGAEIVVDGGVSLVNAKR
jgi:NAD(P)-dependent dehydrogenase (short-subunit alcohol dehydrogenase family)